MLREEKGITLVALIITIIVLIILAAVTIIAVQDSNLVNRTINAAQDYARNQEWENGYMSSVDSKVSSLETVISEIRAGE